MPQWHRVSCNRVIGAGLNSPDQPLQAGRRRLHRRAQAGRLAPACDYSINPGLGESPSWRGRRYRFRVI